MNTTSLVPFFLGTFSGFLATLPIGPAKILAVRKFLLMTKGNQNEVYNFKSSNTILLASICGLILAQILFFLALQFPFLYSLWVKPHFFSFFFVSILLIYLYQIKNIQFNIYNTQPVLTPELNFSYQHAAFLETFLLQLLNPVVLPNPVFCRLTNVFLFRYSKIIPFFAGNFLGLLSGYGTFFLCTLFLLKKLELDAPTIYRLVKIKIHQFFGIVFVIFSFLCLSRTPLPTIKPFQLKAAPTKFSFKTSWYENIWPDSFFGYDRWKRPLRLIAFDNKQSQPNDEIKPFNKMFFSQFFFDSCIKDGKYQLFHNFPQSLSIVCQNLNSLLKFLPKFSQIGSFEEYQNKNLIDDWIKEKKNRQNQINQNINTKINHIDKGIILEELAEKKLSSFDNNKNKISKQMDPRLSTDIRGTKNFLTNKSFLFLTKEFFSKKDSLVPIEKKNLTNVYTKNRLKLFLAGNYQNLPGPKEEKVPFITWKPLVQASSEINQKFNENYLQNNSPVEKKSDLNDLKKTTAWDEIFKKISISLRVSGSQMGQNLFNFQNVESFVDKQRQEENMEWMQEDNTAKMAQIYKPMPLWNLNFNKKELKRQSKNKPSLQRFFPSSKDLAERQNFVPPMMPFFRRNEFPGTITAQRGKALCWNTFQKKPHAPLFVNHLSLLKNFFAKRKKIQINQDVPIRSWKSTSKLFQFLRDYLLSLQAYIRKYFKLPLLIILKNLARQLLFQPAEWEKDWTNLSKELYVDCDFYGKPVSMGVKLPNFFVYFDQKQIKIINPFQLRFWTRSLSKKPFFQESENSSFLNVWGRETKMPFGKVKKSPSFWQLLVERIKLMLKYKILKNLYLSSPIDTVNIQNQLEDKKVKSKYEVQHTPLPFRMMEEGQQSKIQKTISDKDQIKNFQGNSIENNLKYKTTKRKIINNSTKIKTFSHFTQKEKINRIRRYTLKNVSILFQKRWFNLYRFVLKKEKQIFLNFKTNLFQFKKWFLRNNTKMLQISIKLSYNIYRFLCLLCYRVAEFFDFLSILVTKNQKNFSLHLDVLDLNPMNNLSQAYIIHSLWEDRMLSRPNITSLMKLWNKSYPLKNKVEEFLKKQGILENEKPDNLTEYQWKEWLKNFRAFTPSLKLWALWAPNYWTQAVEQYWKELPSSKVESILNQEPNRIDKNSNFVLGNNTITLNKFLEAHLPLFQAAQKQKKLWKFTLLSRNYTDVSNDGDIDSFFIWKKKDFDKKIHFLLDTLKRIKGKNKTLLVSPTSFSSLTQLVKTKSRRNFIQHDIKKELPLIQREKKRLDFDIKLQTLRQRGTFFPLSIKRWKLKKLRNKLARLAKTVIKNPQGEKVSSYVAIGDKNKKMIRELFQSKNKIFENILENWNSKVLDDELFMYNTVSSILRFVNKNINASLLSSGALISNSSDSSLLFPRGKSNSLDLYFVLPEDVYLPTHLREKRILDCFDFENDNKNIQDVIKLSQANITDHRQYSTRKEKSVYTNTINKWRLMLDQNQNLPPGTFWAIKDRQTIVRFLWPIHRLEDLSCINRFWIGTANQSRFSMLRIHTFPNVSSVTNF